MISSFPNPTPHVPTENPRPQAEGADSPGSQRREVLQPAGNKGESSFSQLLTDELGLARSGRPEAEDKHHLNMAAKEGQPKHQENFGTDPSTRYHTTAPNDVGQGVEATLTEPEPTVNPELLDARMLAGALSSWGGLPAMVPMGHPLGLANTPVAGIAPSAGMPPEGVAGLAAEIATGYSGKNGVQTLTVNLEPEHLGRVEVRLLAKGDHLSVRLMASNPEAESALRENIKDLTEAIQVRTGRYQQMEVRVELRESREPDQDSNEKESPDFHHQGSTEDRGSDPETEDESRENQPDQVATEPDPWAQEG